MSDSKSWTGSALSGATAALNATKGAVWGSVESRPESTRSWASYVSSGVGTAYGAVKQAVWGSDTEESARNSATGIGVAVKNAVGTFKQINSFGTPNIFSHISGGTLGWRQINESGKKAIYKPNAANGMLTGLGYATLAGAIAVDAFEIGNAVRMDYEEGSYDNTVVKSASVAGSWAGAVPGALIGATILSPVPLGPLIGGIAGGVMGAVYGSWGAEETAKKLLPNDEKSKL